MPKQLPPADGRHAGPRVVPYESMQLQLLTHHLQENKYEQAVKYYKGTSLWFPLMHVCFHSLNKLPVNTASTLPATCKAYSIPDAILTH